MKIHITIRIILIITFQIINLSLLGQNRWEVYLGHPYRTDYTNYLIETYDRGYILAGGCKGVDGMIMKTDINGSLLYEKDFQYNNEMVVIAAIQDSSGNTYQCGLLVVYGTISWPYLAKFDSCANKVWCNVYNGSPEYMDGWAQDIVFGNNNEIIVLTRLNNLEQNKQIFLFAYDTDGNNLWKKAYATHDDHPLIAAASSYHLLTDNKEFFISGFCYWPFPGGDTNHVFLRPFFIGIDSNYNEKWILPWAVEDSIFGKAYASIALNDSIIVGVGERWLPGVEKNSIFTSFNRDGVEKGYVQVPNEAIGPDIIANVTRDVQKINDTLLITSSIWGTDDDGIISELVVGLDGTIYNLQERMNNLVGNPHMIQTYDSNYLVAIDVLNNSSWDTYLYKINKDLQSVPFDTNQYTYDSLCPYPITSETIDLSDCMIWTDTEEIPTPEEYYAKLKTIPVKAFPNPAKEKITFALENTDKHKNISLECYNVFGQEVHEQKVYTGQLEAVADVGNWGNGLYFVVVKSNGKIVGKGKFVVG